MKRFDLTVLIVAVAIVAGGIGFAAGHATAGKTTASAAAGNGSGGAQGGFGSGGGGGGGFRRGGFGTRGNVTAVSGNTITITDQSGATKTVNVTSSTTYINGADRSQASQSDVTTGSTILAAGQTASDGSISATRVIINPPAPGGGGSGSGGPGASSSGGASMLN